MNSRMYTGIVSHERRIPRRNAFRYGIYFLFLDLDELDALDSRLRLFGHNRLGLFELRDAEHGPRDGSPLRPWIDQVLAHVGIDLTGGRVYLLTFPRALGFKFYPIALWYCYDADGIPVAVLAEVQNTFGQHHNYLLHNCGEKFEFGHKTEKTKALHVSPFIEMDARYEFRLSEPGEKLSVGIYDYVKGPLLLVAALALERRELTDGAILKAFLRYGPMSLRAWLLIHLQALKIVSKGIRYIRRPSPPDRETS
jgi:DUF1365 family protein